MRTHRAIVGLLLVVAACGSTDSGATTTAAPPVVTTTAPTTTTMPPATTTTATVAPTTTTIPPADGVFQVVDVAADDVLNVRKDPNAGAAIVGTLAPGSGVETTGHSTSDVPSAGWWEVRLTDGTIGWVNRHFVGLVDDPSFAAVPCATSTVPSTEPATPSDAVHVLAMEWTSSDACDRLTILLGAGATGDPWGETAAATVPGDIGVTAEGSVVAVSLPESIPTVRPTGNEATGDFGPVAFTVRDERTNGVQGPLEVRLHFDHNVDAAVTFLEGPARIVVDVIDAPTGTGLALAPVVGERVALEHPIQIDVNGDGVPMPITVSGYGRPFEAQGYVELRTVAGTPGAGDPVIADFDGYGPATDSRYSYTTTDHTETWGRFTVTIDGLDPGTYELFVGEGSARDGTPVGIYERFTVAPG